MHNAIQRGIAHKTHPDQGKSGRNQQYTHDKFTNTAPFRDPGNEHPDKWRPRNPPGPVHDGPAANPATWLIGIQIKGHAKQIRDILAGILNSRL